MDQPIPLHTLRSAALRIQGEIAAARNAGQSDAATLKNIAAIINEGDVQQEILTHMAEFLEPDGEDDD